MVSRNLAPSSTSIAQAPGGTQPQAKRAVRSTCCCSSASAAGTSGPWAVSTSRATAADRGVGPGTEYRHDLPSHRVRSTLQRGRFRQLVPRSVRRRRPEAMQCARAAQAGRHPPRRGRLHARRNQSRYGHRTDKEVNRYIETASQKKLSDRALEALQGTKSEQLLANPEEPLATRP